MAVSHERRVRPRQQRPPPPAASPAAIKGDLGTSLLKTRGRHPDMIQDQLHGRSPQITGRHTVRGPPLPRAEGRQGASARPAQPAAGHGHGHGRLTLRPTPGLAAPPAEGTSGDGGAQPPARVGPGTAPASAREPGPRRRRRLQEGLLLAGSPLLRGLSWCVEPRLRPAGSTGSQPDAHGHACREHAWRQACGSGGSRRPPGPGQLSSLSP